MVKGFTFLQTAFRKLKEKQFLLAFVWCVGFALGLRLAATASNTLIPFMHRATRSSASIFGLLVAMVSPFLISFFLHHLYKPLLLLFCFIKAVSYGFCSFALYFAYGTSSWLVHCFFLFSETVLLPVLLFFWRCCLTDTHAYLFRILCICIAFALLIVMVDVCFISPFWLKVVSDYR